MEDHRRQLAMGSFSCSDQNWLLSAVNSSGAVFPADARDARRMPGDDPGAGRG